MRIFQSISLLVAAALASSAFAASVQAAEPPFRAWLETLRPEAEAAGVSRATFDSAFRGVEPDLSLPDLVLPGQSDKPQSRGQAEFTSPPAKYLDKAYLARLAATGRELLAKHRQALEAIERELGVGRTIVLAIWGRETAFGAHKLPHDAIQVIATQAYTGRRKDMFREELIAALKMLEVGVARRDMRSSWAGAVGLTQFMPTEYFKHARDFDGDGKIDLFRSVPDALGSAAQQLKGKGWVAGETWGYEVVIPPGSDCAYEGPTQSRPLSEWVKLGFKRANGKPWKDSDLAFPAYLMSPGGAYGPNFLVFDNFKVIRLYNTSDLYAVFVGNLADRIGGGGDFAAPWVGSGAQKTRVIEEIQVNLKAQGYEVDKIDGKVGSNTRKNIGAYQRANRLKVDCWPTEDVLAHMRSAAAAPRRE